MIKSKSKSAVIETETLWPGKGAGSHGPQFFRNRKIFGKFNASSENYETFALGKDKGFEISSENL